MIADREVKGAMLIISEVKMLKGEIGFLQTLANDIAFAIKAIELEDLKKRAFERIQKNIEQYAILIDQIRNPLSIIACLAELEVGGKTAGKILDQIERIDRVSSN